MRKLLVAVVGLAVLFSACSGGKGEEIGRVGDTAMYLSSIEALYEGDTVTVDESFRQTLFQVLAVEVLEQVAAADLGIAVTEGQVDAYYEEEFVPLLEENDLTAAELLDVPGASDGMLRFNARVLVLRDAVIAELLRAPEFVDQVFADAATLTTVCARHILLETAEEAQVVIDRLAAGEEFDPVARETSTDPSAGENGGNLGCDSASRYVEPFAETTLTAPVGQVVGPVETQFGFHVIIVDDRRVPTREQYLADPTQYVTSEDQTAKWGNWFNAALTAAQVQVAEHLGIWTPVGVEPPAG